MDDNRSRLKAVWSQRDIPVILRRQGKGEKTRARMPGPLKYSLAEETWIQNGRRIYPEWVHGASFWQFPKKWFNDFVERSLMRFTRVYTVQIFREQEICARSCMEAHGFECNCSCMGQNHGMGVI